MEFIDNVTLVMDTLVCVTLVMDTLVLCVCDTGDGHPCVMCVRHW